MSQHSHDDSDRAMDRHRTHAQVEALSRSPEGEEPTGTGYPPITTDIAEHRGRGLWGTIDYGIFRFEQAVILVGLAVGTLATIVEVGARFIFNTTTGTGGELTNNTIIWAALMGAALGVREGVHIGIDEAIKRMPNIATKYIIILGLLVSAAFTAYIAVQGVSLVLFSQSTGQVTMEMYWPRWPFYIAVPLSMTLITIHFLQELVRRLRQSPEEVNDSLQIHEEDVLKEEAAMLRMED